jgi:hypothetical protein
MSQNEVIAASGGLVAKIKDDAVKGRTKTDEALKGEYSTADFKFSVGFVFENDKLTLVRLKPIPLDKVFDVASQLSSVYGKPIESSSSWDSPKVCLTASQKWRDEKAGNQISYFSRSCIQSNISAKSLIAGIAYTPIRSTASTGL